MAFNVHCISHPFIAKVNDNYLLATLSTAV